MLRRGVYVTSKIKHAGTWKSLRQKGLPITSTWIDEPLITEPVELTRAWELWIQEAFSCAKLFVYIEAGDVLKGGMVEIGAALAGGAQVVVVGDPSQLGTAIYHPNVHTANDLKAGIELLGHDDVSKVPINEKEPLTKGTEVGNTLPKQSAFDHSSPIGNLQHSDSGALEEFQALRAEMLQILGDRIWGQATYAVIAGATLAANVGQTGQRMVFLILLAIPFMLHTIFREESRLRMSNYLLVFVEPRIPGMKWERYLHGWRTGEDGGQMSAGIAAKGWLRPLAQIRHTVALSGLYLLTSSFGVWVLSSIEAANGEMIFGIGGFLVILVLYISFNRMYSKAKRELHQLLRLAAAPKERN
jgi:hypothetical protein